MPCSTVHITGCKILFRLFRDCFCVIQITVVFGRFFFLFFILFFFFENTAYNLKGVNCYQDQTVSWLFSSYQGWKLISRRNHQLRIKSFQIPLIKCHFVQENIVRKKNYSVLARTEVHLPIFIACNGILHWLRNWSYWFKSIWAGNIIDVYLVLLCTYIFCTFIWFYFFWDGGGVGGKGAGRWRCHYTVEVID